MKAPARKSQLDQLEGKLHTALGRQTKSIIEIGELLLKCRELLEHGEWMDWLRNHFDLSQRTAQNYCEAAEYVASKGKLATVANLAPTLLYKLAAAGDYSEQQETAILEATHKGRVDLTRADEICQALVPPEPQEPEEEAEEPEDEDDKKDPDEIKKILDGPPPDVPPPAPIAPPINFALRAFDQAVTELKKLVTKKGVKFVTTTHTTDDLEKVLALIQSVLEARERGHDQTKSEEAVGASQ
jgi:hypothetical protein